MSVQQISPHAWSVGVKDPGLQYFDIVMRTEFGTTYNAYLVRGDEKTALIDTVKAEFAQEYLDNVSRVVPIESIDYLISNHTEPDHSGAYLPVLERNPGIEIICSGAAVPFVKSVLNREAKITPVKDDFTLDLGGATLVFKLTPYMHWPDTMMEFLVEDGVLFSCDGFAAHLCSDSLWADEVPEDVDHEVWYYYDCIMRPFAGYIRRNLPKLDAFDITMVAPSHGPLFRRAPRRYIERYKEWTVDKAAGRRFVPVFYASNYGNTEHLATALADRLSHHGFQTEIVNVVPLQPDRFKELLEQAQAIVIGTPTFNGDAVKPIWDFLNLISTVYMIGKKAAVFGSHGWGGEGAKLVSQRLTGLKLKVFETDLRARLIPSDDEMSSAMTFADQIAEFFG